MQLLKIPMSQLVQDPEWQKVREGLVGNWVAKPDWCIKQLRNYLGPITKTQDKKLLIMMNYLTGTGFRRGSLHKNPKVNVPAQKLRDEISKEMKKRKTKGLFEIQVITLESYLENL